jgi:hypothetical protein
MLSILQAGLNLIERLFNEVKPDFIVSFQCVTLGDYLSFLFARSRGIPVLNLRPTRIKNYFYAGETIMEPSDFIKEEYSRFLDNGIDAYLRGQAAACLKEVRQEHALYEGVVLPSDKTPTTVSSKETLLDYFKITTRIIKVLSEEYKCHFGEYKYDNHISGYIGPLIGQRIIRPWRARNMNSRFRNIYVTAKDLKSLNYAFLPLHTEPEVTLSVYSKSYLNQIEAARLLSHNLPVGMKLVIKEHPWAIGRRPISYYKKLLEIPNVVLAHPGLKSRELISHSRLVTIIASSIGLEALMLGKPVVALGGTPFNFLPQTMIRYISNPNLLGEQIRELLDNYAYNEEAILSYIAAVIKNSVGVDFYSSLLGRQGVYHPSVQHADVNEDERRKIHIDKLTGYLLNRYKALNCNISNLVSSATLKR